MMPFNFTKSAFKKSGSSDGLTGHFYEFKGIHLDPQTSKWTAEMGEPDNPETTTMTANTPYLYVPDEEPEYWYIDNGGSGVNIFTQDNGGGKCELWWGNENDKNSTFLHRSNDYGEGTLKNCFYVGTRGLKQGSPAVESATAPTNFAHLGAPTNHCFMQTYGRLIVFNNKYYTPTYGDMVETYDFRGVKSYNIEYDDKPLGIPDITTQLWVPLLRYKRTFTNGKPVTVMMPFNFTKSAFKKSGSSAIWTRKRASGRLRWESLTIPKRPR